jgi:phosphoribosylcarboxyaminoimidazole (NCAIR) mutase
MRIARLVLSPLLALLAVGMLANSRPDLRKKLKEFREKRADEVLQADASVQQRK